MALIDQIDQDLTGAMKDGQETIVSTLRMLKSAIKNTQIQKQKELTDEDIVSVIQSQIKSRQDSVEMYTKGGREELAKKETDEINIIKKYLPEQMSEEEITKQVKSIITELNATSIQDMGKVMGKASENFRGKADMSTVSKIVKENLGA